MTKKPRQKFNYLENEKSFLRWYKKHVSSILKGSHQSKENILLEGESPTLIEVNSK